VTSLIEALEALERLWSEQGAPVKDLLQPGLDSRAMDDLRHRVPTPPHEEVRVLLAWHDGVRDQVSGERPSDRDVGPCGFELLNSAAAVNVIMRKSRLADRLASEFERPRSQFWQDDWFPIAVRNAGESTLVIDGTDGSVKCVYWQDGDSPSTVSSDLFELVSLWKRLLAEGYWKWMHDGWRLLRPLPTELSPEVTFIL